MSYFIEEECGEVESYGTELYGLICPYCKTELESKDVCSMPWTMDSEEEIECTSCHKRFEIRPKYKFEGFYYYVDMEQIEEEQFIREL